MHKHTLRHCIHETFIIDTHVHAPLPKRLNQRQAIMLPICHGWSIPKMWCHSLSGKAGSSSPLLCCSRAAAAVSALGALFNRAATKKTAFSAAPAVGEHADADPRSRPSLRRGFFQKMGRHQAEYPGASPVFVTR